MLKNAISTAFKKNLFGFTKIAYVLLLLVSLVFITQIVSHLILATTDRDLNHCRETGENIIAVLLYEGENPFGPDYTPPVSSPYGPVSYFLAAPFAKDIKTARTLQRALSSLGLLFSMFIIIWASIQKPMDIKNIAMSLCAGTLIVIPLISTNELGSKPGNLGLFLGLMSIVVPYKFGFSKKYLLISTVFIVLSVYSKTYFVFFCPILPVYLFIFKSKATGLRCCIYYICGLLLFALFASAIYPHSVAQILDSGNQLDYLKEKAIDKFNAFADFYLFFIAAFILTCVLRLRTCKEAQLSFITPLKPLVCIKVSTLMLPILASAITFILFSLTLAGHGGGNWSYVSHTFVPFAGWSLATMLHMKGNISPNHLLSNFLHIIIAGFMITQTAYGMTQLKSVNEAYKESFIADERIAELFLNHAQNPMGVRLTSHIEYALGKEPNNFGMTEYIPTKLLSGTVTKQGVPWDINNYFDKQKEGIRRRDYDLIICIIKPNRWERNVRVADQQFLEANGYKKIYTGHFRTTMFHYSLSYYVLKHDQDQWKSLISSSNLIQKP